MYAHYGDKLSEGRESFPLFWILGENLLFLAGWTCAGALLWPVKFQGWPVATLGWVLFVVSAQLALKKHFCSGCYYYGKSCHLGWGRISSKLCAANSGNPKIGMALAVPMYMLSPVLVLLGAAAIGWRMDVGTSHWVLLGVYVVLNAVGFPLRTVGCKACKMRAVCPGSAAKGGA